jgi:protein SCO1/2
VGHTVAAAQSDPPDANIGIDERLGDYVPMDIGFLDADGDSVYLRDVITRPTLLTLVYYHCPTICKPLLGGVAEVVDRSELNPGKDYDLLTVSFNELDTPETARPIKDNFTHPLRRVVETNSWRFLTGDSVAIAGLTGAVGFGFERQEKDFAHGAALIVLSPDGKIVRYLYGMRYQPFDLKMAVTEASKGTIAPSIARVLNYCFSYDPEGRKYVFNTTRVVGAGVLIFAVGWVFYMSASNRNRRKKSSDARTAGDAK